MTTVFAATPAFVAFAYGSICSPSGSGSVALLPPHWAWPSFMAMSSGGNRSRDGSGKCDVVQTNDVTAVVYGVLYEISVGEKLALDKAEGLGNGYEAKNAEWRSKMLPVWRPFTTQPTSPSLKPYTWYKAFVVAGAKHNLPGKYIELLVATDAIEDPDRERHSRNWRLSTVDGCGPRS